MNSYNNTLLSNLPGEDAARLLQAGEMVEVSLSQILCERGTETEFAYFPVDAFVSLISMADARAGVELGMVGNEGLIGSHLCLSVRSNPLRAVVQGAGECLRVPVDEFVDHLMDSYELRYAVQRFQSALTEQQSISAACLRFHQLEQRLARWILMCHDRGIGDSVPMTQELMTYMVGVRKNSPTLVSSTLVRDGCIEYRNGLITVLNRDRLKSNACSCYENDRLSFAKLFAEDARRTHQGANVRGERHDVLDHQHAH